MKNETKMMFFYTYRSFGISQLVTHYLSMHKDADESLVEGAIAEAKELEKQLFPPKVPICETCGKCLRKR